MQVKAQHNTIESRQVTTWNWTKHKLILIANQKQQPAEKAHFHDWQAHITLDGGLLRNRHFSETLKDIVVNREIHEGAKPLDFKTGAT